MSYPICLTIKGKKLSKQLRSGIDWEDTMLYDMRNYVRISDIVESLFLLANTKSELFERVKKKSFVSYENFTQALVDAMDYSLIVMGEDCI